MQTTIMNEVVRRVSVILALFLVGSFTALAGLANAATWGELYHGPETEWWTGTTFYGTLPTSDGGYLLTGTSNNRGVILKVSGDGTLQWSKRIKQGYWYGTAMIGAVETTTGDFIVTGQVYTDETKVINPDATDESWDIYIIRLTSLGERLWENIYARKNNGTVPNTNESPQYIYTSSTPGNYVVTGVVVYSGVPGCPYSGYHASQALVINDDGVVQNDFLMGGPSTPGDGAVQTVYTSDGNYLVLTELCHPAACYTMGLQKYDPSGALLWSKGYYEVYRQGEVDHLLKITAGAVVETDNGYVLAGSTYNNLIEPAVGAYYHFKVGKATGAVKWNKKFKVWPDWNSAWVLDLAKTPDGGLVATIGDGVSTANDRIFKTSQTNGGKLWVNEYGKNDLGTVTPLSDGLAVTTIAYDAVLAKLSPTGRMDESCTALPISVKKSEAVAHPILRTDVHDGFSSSGCNSQVGSVTAYNVDLIDSGEYHQANSCAPKGEVTADWNGSFGTVNVGSSGDLKVYLSNYNGLSNLYVGTVAPSNTTNFSIVPGTDTCSGQTLYPVNQGDHSCQVTVRFAPLTNGVKQGSVKFASNNDPALSQVVNGTGAGASYLKVTISPEAAVVAGAMWRVDGGVWKKSGTKIQLPPGVHEVSYRFVSGWKKPANKTVTTVADQTKVLRPTYAILQ